MNSKQANRLRPYLKRAGMTQAELAKAVGVSPEWMSRIGNGKAVFGELTERRIVRVLNLSNDEANQAFGFPGPHLLKGESERRSHLTLVRPGPNQVR